MSKSRDTFWRQDFVGMNISAKTSTKSSSTSCLRQKQSDLRLMATDPHGQRAARSVRTKCQARAHSLLRRTSFVPRLVHSRTGRRRLPRNFDMGRLWEARLGVQRVDDGYRSDGEAVCFPSSFGHLDFGTGVWTCHLLPWNLKSWIWTRDQSCQFFV